MFDSPDGKYLVTSYADGSVKVWDAVRGSLVSDMRRHTNFDVGGSLCRDRIYHVKG